MKSFEQLAQAAHEAAEKEFNKQIPGYQPQGWASLSSSDQASWVAAAKQLWAEFAAIH